MNLITRNLIIFISAIIFLLIGSCSHDKSNPIESNNTTTQRDRNLRTTIAIADTAQRVVMLTDSSIGSCSISATLHSDSSTAEDKFQIQPVMGNYSYSVNEGQYLSFIDVHDYMFEENEFLEIIADNVPSGAIMPPYTSGTIHIESRFEWVPTYCQQGYYEVYIYKFTDGILQDVNTHGITVKNINPVIRYWNQPDTIHLAVGIPWHIDLQATDEDAICATRTPYAIWNLTYNPSPIGAVINNIGTTGNATFDWTPSITEVGTYTLTFIASDDFGFSQEKNIAVVVFLQEPPCTPVYNKQTGTWTDCNQK